MGRGSLFWLLLWLVGVGIWMLSGRRVLMLSITGPTVSPKTPGFSICFWTMGLY